MTQRLTSLQMSERLQSLPMLSGQNQFKKLALVDHYVSTVKEEAREATVDRMWDSLTPKFKYEFSMEAVKERAQVVHGMQTEISEQIW